MTLLTFAAARRAPEPMAIDRYLLPPGPQQQTCRSGMRQ